MSSHQQSHRGPPNPGIHHTASAPPVPPNAMPQYSAPQHPAPPHHHPPPHMLQSPPPTPYSRPQSHTLQSPPPPGQPHPHAQMLRSPAPIITGAPSAVPGPRHSATAPSPLSPHHPQSPDSADSDSRRSSAEQMYTPKRVSTFPTDNPHAPSPTARYPPRPPPAQHPYAHPQGPAPHRPQPQVTQDSQAHPNPYESTDSHIPTLAELEGRSPNSNSRPSSRHYPPPRSSHAKHRNPHRQPLDQGSGSQPNSRPSSRQSSRQGDKDKSQGWKAKIGALTGHEGAMDSVELAMEGVVKAAGAL